MDDPISLKRLLSKHGLSIDSASAYRALIKTGIMREVEYESTTGSGEMKSFKELSAQGL